jgi:hypothetical protein
LGEPQAVITATESEKKVDQDESAEDQNKLWKGGRVSQ